MKKNTNKNLPPDFLIIGAGKSGTTSIDNYLKQHPEIFMSERKEPNFLAIMNMDPVKRNSSTYYDECVNTMEEYEALFVSAPENVVKGETSPMYLYSETAPYTIKSYIPEVKLIAILRQPVERLYSRYLHLARENLMPTNTFRDVLNRDSIWWNRDDLVTEGFFYRNLSKYYNLFPRDQIRVYLYEDLKKTDELLKDIFRFLGVSVEFEVDSSSIYNKSGFKKSKIFDYTLGHNSLIKKSIKRTMPKVFEKVKSNLFMQKAVNSLQNANLSTPPLESELYQQIVDEVYREDIDKLQELIGRDLSGWLKAK